jgi:hypothetical protein
VEHSAIQEGLSAISAGASTLTGWTLAILGATTAGFVGSKYLRPTGKLRCLYLLFIPGWFLLGISMWFGEKVARRAIAAAFAAKDEQKLLAIGQQINADYDCQRFFFQFALIFFVFWLVGLLLWWVLRKETETR